MAITTPNAEAITISRQRIWYASYGSNLRLARFMTYVIGGQAEGSDVPHEGCTDKTPPTNSRAIELPQSLYFAGQSWHWQGAGAAFTTLEKGARPTLAKAYSITDAQFADVVAQENGVPLGSQTKIDIDWVRDSVNQDLFPGEFYSTLQYGGELDGDPILSLTGPRRPLNVPAEGYVKTIGLGLMEAHELSEGQTAVYLANTPGAVGALSVRQVAALLFAR